MGKDDLVRTERTYTLTALTDLWTGSVRLEERNGQLRERIVPDRLITTGLLGSIRWWFEVLVRGLRGSGCDPSDSECQDRDHCAVCELFGCTGWARKFRFDVLDANGASIQQQIKKGTTFQLRFTRLRPVRDEEWALLDLTLRLIAEYGAIGGKTVYKPTEEGHRQMEQHHQDFGLVKLVPDPPPLAFTEDELQRYVSGQRWRRLNHGDFAWASLDNFWCVSGQHLARQAPTKSDFNRVLSRDERKTCRDCGQVHNPPQKCSKTRKHPRRYSDQNPAGSLVQWLAGGRAESKKVLSFKNPESARRTFGFVQSKNQLDEMRQRLRDNAWHDLRDDEFATGDEILRRLLGEGGTG
jgi:CRISPR-associated protein Cmr1